MPLQATSGAASYDAFGGGVSVVPKYIENVFSTYLYTGNGTSQTINNGLSTFVPTNENNYTTPGTYSFEVPAGITSISAVVVGGGGAGGQESNSGGGGGGGALSYGNNISVTPGETLTVVVGSGGPGGNGGRGEDGGNSSISRGATVLLQGGGGQGGAAASSTTPAVGGTSTGTARTGGGSGGAGSDTFSSALQKGGGAGGAGGFSGNGGAVGSNAATGGGGGGGGGSGDAFGSQAGGGGGGAGITAGSITATGTAGASGTGGGAGSDGFAGSTQGGGTGGAGGFPGGGGGGAYSASSGSGANGAARIVYPGSTRQFPATSVTQTSSSDNALVWIKGRSGATNHALYDTVRGKNNVLVSNTTAAQATQTNGLTAFTSSGFTLGNNSTVNTSSATYASWTFVEQPKFFDIVTFTTEASNTNQRISHSLGSVPGMIIVKSTSAVDNWFVWHRSMPTTTDYYLYLNSSSDMQSTSGAWGTTGPTSTDFGINDTFFGGSRAMVAYVFAHDAGGFGLTGTDNVVSCGSFTTDGSGNFSVELGYEPQWVLFKATDVALGWNLYDNMRGMPASSGYVSSQRLVPQSANAEGTQSAPNGIGVSSTGFSGNPASNLTNFIYIAIRRGPMKVPTSGASVFGLNARTGTGANATVTGGSGVSDTVLIKNRGSALGTLWASRLTGTNYLLSSSDAGQVAAGTTILQANPWDVMDGVKVGTTSTITNASSNTFINYLFKRTPSVFDVVCYTGDGTGSRNITHNLNTVPELMILRRRNAVRNWFVYSAAINADRLFLNSAAAAGVGDRAGFLPELPTSTQFTVGGDDSNSSNQPFISYFFATCAGVSKVGSYTGTGTTLTINCGFTGGARFVLIKCTTQAYDWMVFDTARGINSANDPFLVLNSTVAENTISAGQTYDLDWIDPDSTGFTLPNNYGYVNASGETYIFLAIA